MIYAICWALIGICVVLGALHYINHLDQRALAKAARDYQAALDAAKAAEGPQDGQRPMQNTHDVRDWSRRHGNGPENAKYEGVSRERGNH